jgi:hypothetical protein
LWTAVGLFGTHVLLYGTDAFSTWLITSALGTIGDPNFGRRLSTMLIPGALPPGIVMLVGGIATVCGFAQAILMLFRDGSVLVLAAVKPLAAAGSFTTVTAGWMRRVVTWQLALIFYKPTASMVYATAIWLQGEKTSKDPRVWLMGVAMMIVALVAMPVLLRFFTWTTGAVAGGGGGLGMLASAGAAGIHGVSSLRGAGSGFGVNEHARYLSDVFDRGTSPSGNASGSSGGPGGNGLGPKSPGTAHTGTKMPGFGPGGGPSGPGIGKAPPMFTDVSGGKVGVVTTARGGPTGATSTAGMATPMPGAAAGSAAAGAGGVGAAATVASGPAAPITGTVVAVGTAVTGAAKSTATAAASAMSDSNRGGGDR